MENSGSFPMPLQFKFKSRSEKKIRKHFHLSPGNTHATNNPFHLAFRERSSRKSINAALSVSHSVSATFPIRIGNAGLKRLSRQMERVISQNKFKSISIYLTERRSPIFQWNTAKFVRHCSEAACGKIEAESSEGHSNRRPFFASRTFSEDKQKCVLKSGLSSFGGKWKRFFAGILIFSLLAFETGCTVWYQNPLARPAQFVIPEEMLAYYRYPREPLTTTVLMSEDRKNYVFKQVEFPLSLPKEMWIKDKNELQKEMLEIKKTNEKEAKDRALQYTNRLDLYLPKRVGKKPAIIISPILGGNMIVDRFAKFFATHGYVAVIVHRKKIAWDETQDMKQIEQYLRSSVIRLRQSVDWLETQPEVDPNRIGGFGISYGAILHAVLAAIEPRVKFHILAMPGGALPEVIMACPDPQIRKLRKKLNHLGWTNEKIYSELKREIKTDPIKFAPYIPKERTMVMMALFDRVVGVSRTFKLWKKMGKPKLKIIPLGHYGGLLVFPYLEFVSLRFFARRL